MKLEPGKRDYSKLIAELERLSGLRPKGADRDWAADTIKTLQSGKLEDFDLIEFVVDRYDTQLASAEDRRPVWEASRSLLALIAEMEALKVSSPKTDRVRDALNGWTLE